MTGFSDSVNPPIIELAISAQFSPLTKLSAGHFGLFWKELGNDWTDPGDGQPIEDQFELFDRPRPIGLQMRLQPMQFPGRFTLGHKNKDRLLQIQSTRFCLNWRRKDQFYPSYKRLIGEFVDMFTRFATFIEGTGLGMLAVNQWELTYIDSFPKDEYWITAADWSTVLPGLFGQLFSTEGLGVVLENRMAEWSYEITPKLGRLHISALPGRAGDDRRDSLLLTTTARGIVGKGGVETLRAGLDRGHDAIYGAFLRIVSGEVKKRLGTQS